MHPYMQEREAEEVSVAALVKMLEQAQNQSLLKQIFDEANSAYYHPLERITTLRRAVVVLGTDAVRNLLLQTNDA